MKLILLNGSPRHHGNTRAALLAMREFLLKEGHTTQVLDVCTLKLSGCRACDGCKGNGGHCVCPDESDEVMERIAGADAVIFGTPVYWWGMSAQLKTVVDKFYSRDDQFKAMKKRMGVVVTGANDLSNPQYRLIREQFQCIGEYLHWEPAFFLSFSAYGPGELMTQEGVPEQLEQACARITAQA